MARIDLDLAHSYLSDPKQDSDYAVSYTHLDVYKRQRQAEVLIQGTEYRRCEIGLAQRQEMIVKLEDFLRRRSKIALVVRPENIRHAPGLMDACEMPVSYTHLDVYKRQAHE